MSQNTLLNIAAKRKADLKIFHKAQCQNLAGTLAVQDTGAQGMANKGLLA